MDGRIGLRIVLERDVAPPEDRRSAREQPVLIRSCAIGVADDVLRFDALGRAERGKGSGRLADRPFNRMHAVCARRQVRCADVLTRRDEVVELFGDERPERHLKTQVGKTVPRRSIRGGMNVDGIPADATRVREVARTRCVVGEAACGDILLHDTRHRVDAARLADVGLRCAPIGGAECIGSDHQVWVSVAVTVVAFALRLKPIGKSNRDVARRGIDGSVLRRIPGGQRRALVVVAADIERRAVVGIRRAGEIT